MIESLIEDIQTNTDELYMKHDLMTAGIEVSEHLYRVILEHSIELMSKKLLDPKPPVSLLGIPIVINNYLSDFDYRLVVSIPSYRFRKGGNKKDE